jgi:hypothetical protein
MLVDVAFDQKFRIIIAATIRLAKWLQSHMHMHLTLLLFIQFLPGKMAPRTLYGWESRVPNLMHIHRIYNYLNDTLKKEDNHGSKFLATVNEVLRNDILAQLYQTGGHLSCSRSRSMPMSMSKGEVTNSLTGFLNCVAFNELRDLSQR